MVSVACGKCGTSHQVDAASVPPSGKVMSCTSCGEPITVLPGDLSDDIQELDMDDVEEVGAGQDLADLPAPARRSPLAGASNLPAPAVQRGPAELPNLPAPVQRTGLDAAQPEPPGYSDLPAPVRPKVPKLPGPPKVPAGVSGLPAPAGVSGLPAPAGVSGLPAPVGISGLPTPAGVSGLPAPANGVEGLPAPKEGGQDLKPAGGLPDLLSPVGGGEQLPAPKGFFDGAVAPKGQQPGGPAMNLPAPKGFFDDAVSPVTGASGEEPVDLPAPKGGFFDDAVPSQVGIPQPGGTKGGFFDDAVPSQINIPQPAGNPPGHAQLEGLDLSPPGDAPPAAMLDLGDPVGGGDAQAARPFGLDSLDLEVPDDGAPPPSVPIGLPDVNAGGDRFGEVELPDVGGSPSGAGVVSFSAPSGAPPPPASAAPAMPAANPFGVNQEALGDLELDSATGGDPSAPARKQVRRSASKEPSPEEIAQDLAKKKTFRNIVIAGLAVAGIGVGGFFGFQKWQEAKEASQELGAGVASARKHLSADAPGHWDNAAREATRAAKLDPSNAEALAIAGQAYYAAVIDEGTAVDDRKSKGSQFIKNIRAVAAQGEEVDKAEALQSIVERRAKEAIIKLQQVTGHNDKDINGKLYLGWAYVYNHDWTRAIEQFDAVLAVTPTRIPALYGKGNAHLALGDTQKAREAYLSVIKQSRDKYKKDHIGALVGVAQLAEIDRFSDRENRYLEILERKDLDKEDPRSVSSAWSLAGDEALRAGRIDEAQQRYDRALALDPENLSAFVGEGNVGLRSGRLDIGRERLERVLSLDPGHINATILLSQVALAEGRLEDAEKRIDLIFKREPPVQSHETLLRAHMARGAIFEADPSRATAAESEYRSAMKYAGSSEIGPTISLSKLFVKQGRGPDALAVLDPVKSAARQDPALAVSLGVAYLDTGEPVQAEQAFRMALDRRPNDVEAQYQLGIALFAQKNHDDALDALRTAYAANESREDIGLRLALSYEQLLMDKEADELYVKLLSSRAPSINARSRAGRFYARIENIPQAASLGELILQEQDRHPTGLYLIGEKLFAAGEFKDAQRNFRDAVRLDPQAQFLEALGRASEKLALLEDALLDYGKAIEAEAKYLRPRLGRARIRLVRREFSRALKEFEGAKTLEPENPIIWAGIGICQNEMRRHDVAVQSLRKAIALKSPDPMVWYYLGRSYYDLDKPKEAAAAFNAAAKRATGDEKWISEAYRLQGYAYRSAKNKAGAIKAWTTYLDLIDPKSAEARDVVKLLMRLQAR